MKQRVRSGERLLWCAILPILVVFAEPDFPTRGVENGLVRIGGAIQCESSARLIEELKPGRTLVWRHGSTFPAEAWPAFVKFLEGGGSFLHLGPEPFTHPVTGNPGARVVQPRTLAMLKALKLNQCVRLQVPAGTELGAWCGEGGKWQTMLTYPEPGRVAVLEPRLADTRDFSDEDGAPGARDAILRPLTFLRRPGDDPRFPFAADSFAIDRLRGRFAGGRWIFRLGSAPRQGGELSRLMAAAACAPLDLRADPTFGCFHAGERPSVVLRVHRPGARDTIQLLCSIQVTDEAGRQVWCDPMRRLRVGRHASMPVALPFDAKPGLYRVAVTSEGGARHETGFWVFDEKLFTSGDDLTFDTYALRRNGKPEPVIGTTVMSPTVHRKFLFEPNAAAWDDTFAELESLNVNLVRTGIWSAYRKISLDPNVVDEAFLRALEAYYLTARKHGIPIVFTFFAFSPEDFGGQNPYLDPRAIEGQRAYLSAVASRFRDAKEMHWDLINEPSFSNPKKLWMCRPTGDRHEQAAFLAWLETRHRRAGDDPKDDAWQDRVRSRWRLRPGEAIGLPVEADFQERHLFGEHRPYRAREFLHFAQDAFAGWIREMTAAIREAGSPNSITVGQDEGGLADRPGPLLHYPEVDYTSIHTWWSNDALLWDGLMAKAPGTPLLVSETGIMQRELLSGEMIRTPDEAASLLSRKIGYTFAARAFGLVQWCYTVNPYMDLDNEAAIGLRRADGSYKPEHAVLREFAAFFRRSRDWFSWDLGIDSPTAKDMTVIVLPHGDHFSPRGLQTQATRRLVAARRRLSLRPMQIVSEYRTAGAFRRPAFIVLPSCRGVSDAAWRDILAAVERGSTLVCSGWFEQDDAGRPALRLGTKEQPLGRRPLRPREMLTVGAREVALDFSVDVFQSVFAADLPPVARRLARGQGAIIHYPVPVDLAAPDPARDLDLMPDRRARHPDTDPAVEVYRHEMDRAVFVVAINPSNRPGEAWVEVAGEKHRLWVPAGRTRMALYRKEDGKLIDFSHRGPGSPEAPGGAPKSKVAPEGAEPTR